MLFSCIFLVKKGEASGRVCWGGERTSAGLQGNHTKGGMKKLLLCMDITALFMPSAVLGRFRWFRSFYV
jgi:hypothetical protein